MSSSDRRSDRDPHSKAVAPAPLDYWRDAPPAAPHEELPTWKKVLMVLLLVGAALMVLSNVFA